MEPKKLIEVALPLEAINLASAREKSIRHGHPSTLHLWWARRPLAAARAVIFAQMVDDPSSHPDLFKTAKAQDKERQRLFRILEELVKWESTANETVLQRARDEIWQSWRYTCAANADHPRARELFDRYTLPAFHDPFAGGGALPSEAQRLGLTSHASDLNPVAVLINKATIEIPPRFAGSIPVNPQWRDKPEREKVLTQWRGAQGLAADIRFYGEWMRDRATERIGKLYPLLIISHAEPSRPDLAKYVGRSLKVIAWLWARTVLSPDPAFNSFEVPLVSTFFLCAKTGKEVYIEAIVQGPEYSFFVRTGQPPDPVATKMGTKLSRGANFRCLLSGTPITANYIRGEAMSGRMKSRLLAVVADGDRERVYVAPTSDMERLARTAAPKWQPDVEFFPGALGFRVGNYGMSKWSDLFTPRQLTAISTFGALVSEAVAVIRSDALVAGMKDDGISLEKQGQQALAYAQAIGIYLAFGVDKLCDRHSTLCTWDPTPTASGILHVFSRHALPMTWDYAEGNPFSEASGNFESGIGWIAKAVETSLPSIGIGDARFADASDQTISAGKVVSTDPPYYDNVGYADLSDFFYVWLRFSLRGSFPTLFGTMATPKAEELVATPERHGGKERADNFFLTGMTRAMKQIAMHSHPGFPVTIYYAFKQTESDRENGNASTGWETFLEAVIRSGFAITGTWPIRTELGNRLRGIGSNALASSIVLVCRTQDPKARSATRREFVNALKLELPEAIAHLRAGNIAPVDLAQSSIGPGMAVYTRYREVLDADGKPLSVRSALTLINATLDDALVEQEGDFDADSRWALTWFDQNGFAEGDYGQAEQLSKSKNTSVGGLVEAGILISKAGKVRLLRPEELPTEWDPHKNVRLTAWEIVHHLVRVLGTGGEAAAAMLVAKLGGSAESARELCYRLYMLCERKKRASDAMAYNGLVQSWPEIIRLAGESKNPAPMSTIDDMFAKE